MIPLRKENALSRNLGISIFHTTLKQSRHSSVVTEAGAGGRACLALVSPSLLLLLSRTRKRLLEKGPNSRSLPLKFVQQFSGEVQGGEEVRRNKRARHRRYYA